MTTLEGLLCKKPDKGLITALSWKTRYFVQEKDMLKYYKKKVNLAVILQSQAFEGGYETIGTY
jgi:hypothetical protein